jgi:putative pyruvate formate lyase activating enzyme
MFQPSYRELYHSGELADRIKKAHDALKDCQVCPRRCRVNRLADEKGMCNIGELPMVSSYSPHFGEEAPLVGRYGSGTIFLTSCSLGCLFCQNYDISHFREGREVSLKILARMMIELQNMGCHNINFVTPSHIVPQILGALPFAIEEGLSIPLVYNTSGYDNVATIKLLDKVFDIYMPDMKFADSDVAKRLCNAEDYPKIAMASVKEMHRQVGDLQTDERGIAFKGLLVRHLVMPEGLAGTREIMRFLAKEISRNTYVNIMNQYRPCGEAYHFPPLNRRITGEEYHAAISIAHEEGIRRLDSLNHGNPLFPLT